MNVTIEVVNHDESKTTMQYPHDVARDMPVSNLMKTLSPRSKGIIKVIKYEGRILDQSRTLSGNGVPEKAHLVAVTVDEDARINVTAKVNSSNSNIQTVKVRTNPDATTEAVLGDINKKLPFQTEGAHYHANGEGLKPGKTLREQKIGDGSVINIQPTVTGGIQSGTASVA